MANPLALIFGFFGFLVMLWLMFIALGILAFVFWIMMIVDVAQRKFKDSNDKIVWILVVVLLHIIGAIVYYFVVKRKSKK